MSCHPASSKQRDYADSLVEYLEKEQHRSATRYKAKVDGCDCIAEMSGLIDKMKKLREEIQEADNATKYRG
ncbi:hypothetical protein LCGC14_1709240 [marine sediment metagenome]|uniref:Uncharacterized protein n=1 Tax=marine sediment metagenome TaxID=412755 RepID=A0A0F9I397_9ZZZZ